MTKGFPLVAVWQLDLDPSHRVLAAGTHGRGAYTVADTVSALGSVGGLVHAAISAGRLPSASGSRRTTPELYGGFYGLKP